MAEATRTEREIETVTITKEPVIVLELTEAEARTLRVLVVKISGSGLHSPRKHTNSIDAALAAVVGYYGDQPEYSLAAGNFSFKDYPSEPEAPRAPRVFRRRGGAIPLDVNKVHDGDSWSPIWTRRVDGEWQNENGAVETESGLFESYPEVTEVL
jgi:hypothetical protein